MKTEEQPKEIKLNENYRIGLQGEIEFRREWIPTEDKLYMREHLQFRQFLNGMWTEWKDLP
ncbi:MAG TPA: hypothetical protein VF905_14345 [Nitrospirota bacterium]